MKWNRPQFWIGVFSLCGVLSAAVVSTKRTSPGPIASVHAQHEDLARANNCADCHGGWRSDMQTSCLACHTEIESQVALDEGLHGKLERSLLQRCALCHSEHHGAQFAIVNAMSFAKAGFASRADFDHNFVGYDMQGKHLEVECKECHVNADVAVLPADAHRYLGVDRDCATCHEDPHEGKLVRDCADCHDQTAFDSLHSLGHDKFLPLEGGHGDVSCRDCHAAQDPHALEVVVRVDNPAEARECLDCHSSPHAFDFVERVAEEVQVSPESSCRHCHQQEHLSFVDETIEVTPELHAKSGFGLLAPHAEVSCDACHQPELEDFSARYPGRGQDQCAACHEDPHGGQFNDVLLSAAPYGQAGCLACHDRLEFEPHRFDLAKHGLSKLPLEGRHAELECQACHEAADELTPRQFDGVTSECAGCHQDAHLDFFEPFTTILPPVEHGDCARCHQATHFADTEAGQFDHALHTPFAVLGAHAQAGCEVCHPSSAEPDANGRRFGFVHEHFGTFQGCVTCHADPHGGQFDGQNLPAALEGRSDCARCHDSSSFRSLPHGFDHGLWTAYDLTGTHARAACSACHTPLRRADDQGRTFERAAGTQCYDCHQDPHAGQFLIENRTDCARCHADTESFNSIDFDHDRDSRFPLEGAHREQACAACHKEVSFGEQRVVQYRPLGIECTDCHGIQPGPLRKQAGALR